MTKHRKNVGWILVFALAIVLVLIPSARGVHNGEWLLGVGLTYMELVLSVGAVVLWMRFLRRYNLFVSAESSVGLGVAIELQIILGLFKWFFVPELLRFDGDPDPRLIDIIGVAFLLGFLVFGLWMLAFRYPESVVREVTLKRGNRAPSDAC